MEALPGKVFAFFIVEEIYNEFFGKYYEYYAD